MTNNRLSYVQNTSTAKTVISIPQPGLSFCIKNTQGLNFKTFINYDGIVNSWLKWWLCYKDIWCWFDLYMKAGKILRYWSMWITWFYYTNWSLGFDRICSLCTEGCTMESHGHLDNKQTVLFRINQNTDFKIFTLHLYTCKQVKKSVSQYHNTLHDR